jgi:oleate hydratase
MWATTFAFQPWHSAVEFRRYLHRFIKEFSRIETLAGVKRTVFNQFDSLVRPLQAWLSEKGVNFQRGCFVTDFDLASEAGKVVVQAIKVRCAGKSEAEAIAVGPDDLVFLQNGSMTDASSFGSMTRAPDQLTKQDSGGWTLWEKLAEGRPEFGNPAAFNSSILGSYWESFAVTLRDTIFFDRMEAFTGNKAGTGGLVTFKDSRWLMSVVLPHQPRGADQRSGWRRNADTICYRRVSNYSHSFRRALVEKLKPFAANAVFSVLNFFPSIQPALRSDSEKSCNLA